MAQDEPRRLCQSHSGRGPNLALTLRPACPATPCPATPCPATPCPAPRAPQPQIHRCLYFCILRANELDTPEGTDALFKDARSRKLKLLPPAAPVLAAAAAGAAHSSLGCSSSEGLQWLERQAAPVLWDVALNPLRLGSWAALKLLYTRAARWVVRGLWPMDVLFTGSYARGAQVGWIEVLLCRNPAPANLQCRRWRYC